MAQQQAQGIPVQRLDAAQARELLPIADFHDAALIGFEPEAGFADAYLVATSFARAARRRGVTIRENVAVHGLSWQGGRVTGVATSEGTPKRPVKASARSDEGVVRPVAMAVLSPTLRDQS
ncbi:NAD(P)/FAD-dependent oxidoreductase [Lactiplantibacillus plantarum]|uniref:NAD(P)/FAD-dependent oxidoreductase n=1 Tax=Lactiplantibacillus plantarum TaxID=1590 RepID=UPI0040464FB3